MPVALVEFEPCVPPTIVATAEASTTTSLMSLTEESSVIRADVLQQMKLALRNGSLSRNVSASDDDSQSQVLPAVSALNVRASALSVKQTTDAADTPTYFLVPNTNPPIYVAANPKLHEQVVADERVGVKRSRSESAATEALSSDEEPELKKRGPGLDLNVAESFARSLLDWCDLYTSVHHAHCQDVKRRAAKSRARAKVQPTLQTSADASEKQITLSPGYNGQSSEMLGLSLSLPSSPSVGSTDSLSSWLDGYAESDTGSSSAATSPMPPDDDEELPHFDLAGMSSATASEDEGAGLWHPMAAPTSTLLLEPKQHAYSASATNNVFQDNAANAEAYF